MPQTPNNSYRRKEILRGILAVSIIIVGITHFIKPEQYARIVPPPFPPFTSVYLSGFFEILGGIGLMLPFVRVAAAWGLVSLFIAVFPANIYMTKKLGLKPRPSRAAFSDVCYSIYTN